jgi:hypothetical protein
LSASFSRFAEGIEHRQRNHVRHRLVVAGFGCAAVSGRLSGRPGIGVRAVVGAADSP